MREIGAQLDGLRRLNRPDLAERAFEEVERLGTPAPVLHRRGGPERLLESLQMRREMVELGDGDGRSINPGLAALARSLAGAPNLPERLTESPLLSAYAFQRIRGRYAGTEMIGPDGVADGNGASRAYQRPPDLPPSVRCASVQQARALGLAQCPGNAGPDVRQLKVNLRFVVALLGGPSGPCSGSLIGPGLVVTAAHCVPPGSGALPQGGMWMRVPGGPAPVGVRAVRQLPSHAMSGFRDVAILQTDTPPWLTGVTAGRIAPARDDQALFVLLAGYGLAVTRQGERLTSDNPFYGQQVVDFPHTRKLPGAGASIIAWKSAEPFRASQCGGDSGGPVFAESPTGIPMIVGLIMRGRENDLSTPALCAHARKGQFVDFGHSLNRDDLCAMVADLGSPCISPALVPP